MNRLSWWPWLPPSRGDVLAILFGVALLVAVLVALVIMPRYQDRIPAGFGPDWRCITMPSGDSVCLKKPPDRQKETSPARS
jgi:hypothetical protein